MRSQVPVSIPRARSGFSGGSRNKKRGDDEDNDEYDDESVTTLATGSPMKYDETSRRRFIHSAKVFPSQQKQQQKNYRTTSSKKNVDVEYDEESVCSIASEERDAEPSRFYQDYLTIRRSSSFQHLRKKFEKISASAMRRQRQYQPARHNQNNLIINEDQLPSYSGRTKNNKKSVSAAAVESVQHNSNKVSASESRTDKTKSISNNAYDDEAGQDAICGSTMIMKQLKEVQDDQRNFEDATGYFFNTLRKEMKITSTKVPKTEDDFILFLGEELERDMCGHPTNFDHIIDVSNNSFVNDDQNDVGQVVDNSGRNPVMVMLESLETGYEASLTGCGVAQLTS
jgi:hypothetical protein